MMICKIENCNKKHKAKGYCTDHYQKNRLLNMSNVSEYLIYHAMKQRCNNKSHKNYISYGGRGIKVCDRWLESFDNFMEDMGKRPSKHHSIEREDNDGNYEPGNCRWATMHEQSFNRRLSSRNKSGIAGVSYFAPTGKWRARITFNYRSTRLGSFDTKQEAIKARKQAEEERERLLNA